MNFDFGFIVSHLGALAEALKYALAISVVGIVGSWAVGIAGAAISVLRVPLFYRLQRVYVEAFRNTPLLVQVFFIFYALPIIGITWSAFTVGCVALILWGGAYQLENFRAAFEALDHRQIESSRALGFSRLATFSVVRLPLGLRAALPSVTNTSILVFKDSSYMMAIGYPELTHTAYNLAAQTFRVFEVFAAIGVIYLGVVWIMSKAARAVEARLAI